MYVDNMYENIPSQLSTQDNSWQVAFSLVCLHASKVKLIFNEVKLFLYFFDFTPWQTTLYLILCWAEIAILFCFSVYIPRCSSGLQTHTKYPCILCCFVFHAHQDMFIIELKWAAWWLVWRRLPYKSMHCYSSHKLISSNAASCMLLSPIVMATGTIDSPAKLLHHILESATTHSSTCY